jgi:hypothetical protein
VHWAGHSLGGTLLYAYELAHGRAHLASGITIASPPGLQPFWSKLESRLIWVLERAPGAFAVVQRGLAPLHAIVKPRTRMIPIDWENLNPRFGVAEFFSSVETPPGPVTRTLEECARHRYLAVDNDRVNVLAGLKKLETPLLVFGCPLDPIVPVGPLREFFDQLPTDDKQYIELSRAEGCERDYDHIDPPFAKNAATEVFAHIAEWMLAHPARTAPLESAPAPAMDRRIAAEEPMPAAPVQPSRPAPEPAVAPAPATATQRKAAGSPDASEKGALWDRALRDAASILDGISEGGSAAEERTAKPTFETPKRQRPARAASKTKKAKGTPTKTKVATKRRAAKTANAKPKQRAKAKSKEAPKPKKSTASRKTAKNPPPSKKKAAPKKATKSKTKKQASKKSKAKTKTSSKDSKKKQNKAKKKGDKGKKKSSKK